MQHRNGTQDRSARRALAAGRTTALAVAITLSLAVSAHAGRVTPPPVPANLEVDAGSKAFLVGHAIGTQNYVCLPAGLGFAWTLFTPVATLFGDNGKQLTTHFASPNPVENGTIRPAWQHSQDTSSVWVRLLEQSSDPAFVEPGAIPWFLLEVVGTQEGTTGRGALTATAQIHRVNTVGGVAPATGCAEATDVGKRVFVAYAADYVFYSKPAQAAP
jgi:hypothetical protein